MSSSSEEDVLSDVSLSMEESVGEESSESDIECDYNGYACEPEYSNEELKKLGILQPSENDESQESEAEEADSSRMENLHWCTCGECYIMPSLIESRCCRECPNLLEDKLDNRKCIIHHEDLGILCLSKTVLNTAFIQYRRYKKNYKLVKVMNNTQLRFMAYHQYSAWSHHESLGRGNRVVIPACVVKRIRQEFPSENDQYTGYKEFIESEK